jgi:hypothetical protein
VRFRQIQNFAHEAFGFHETDHVQVSGSLPHLQQAQIRSAFYGDWDSEG